MIERKFNYKVLYADSDAMGIVYYANYLRLYEAGRLDLMNSVGISLIDLANEGIIFPAVYANIKYILPIKVHTSINVVSRIESLPSARLIFIQEIYDENNKLANRAEICLAFLNEKLGRPVRCPSWVYEAFEKKFIQSK